MTTLDHSSTSALVDDLNRHKDGRFCFKSRHGDKGALWRLKDCRLSPLQITIVTSFGGARVYEFDRCDDGLFGAPIVGCPFPWMVYRTPSAGRDSVDSQQRDRLDENLRGVFS